VTSERCISVVVPVHNAENYVGQAVESALNQPEVGEVMLVEDGSRDSSLEVCQCVAERHARVKLLQHSDRSNHGAAASRNLGIRSAAFEFIAFLDADDYFLPGRFTKTAETFRTHEDADGVYEAIGVEFMSPELEESWSRLPFSRVTTVNRPIEPDRLFVELMQGGAGYFSFDGFTARRQVFSTKGLYFSEKMAMAEDTELMYRLCADARLYPGSIETPVTIRRVHEGNRVTGHIAERRKAYETLNQVWLSLLEWGENRLTRQQKKSLLRRCISHTIKTDRFDDFRWADYFASRRRLFRLLAQAPELVTDRYFWRKMLPCREVFRKR